MMNGNPKFARTTARARAVPYTILLAGLISLVAALAMAFALPAGAAEAPVDLGTAASYSVLGGQAVTNTGPSTMDGDVGVSPGTAIIGFPPGLVGGAVHAGDANAAGAQSDLVIAYNDAAGRAPSANIAGDLGGLTLTAGVYKASGSIGLTNTVTLDAQGNPDATFIFQIGSTLITASGSHVAMVNGTNPCNVFWQVGSSATLGTGSTFIGTIMALTSVTVTTGTNVTGRALARNGSVTLDTNTFVSAACDTRAAESSSAAAASSSAAAASSSSAAARSSSAAARSSSSAAHRSSVASHSSLIGTESPSVVAPPSSGTTTTVANTGPQGPVLPLLALSGGLIGLGLVLLMTNRRHAHAKVRATRNH